MTYPGIENSPAAVEANPDRVAVEERRREREQEYEKYEATQDIPWGNVMAYFAGERVSTAAAEEYGWLDLGLVKLVGGSDTDQGDPTNAQDNQSAASQRPVADEPTAGEKLAAAAAAKAAKKNEEAK
jgi:hypothetical protein